jgi:hypothetical protein
VAVCLSKGALVGLTAVTRRNGVFFHPIPTIVSAQNHETPLRFPAVGVSPLEPFLTSVLRFQAKFCQAKFLSANRLPYFPLADAGSDLCVPPLNQSRDDTYELVCLPTCQQ